MVCYAISNEMFSIASSVESDLGRLTPTVILYPRRGRQGRGGSDQKQAENSR